MRGIAYAAFVLCAVLHPSLVVALLVLAVAVWVHNQWQRVANIAFWGFAGDSFAAFSESALTYQFPSHRRGSLWNLGESAPAMALSVSGLGLLLVATLPFIEHSDALITPIPGVYLPHSGLPYWMLSGILIIVGILLVSAGTVVDRSTKRRSMRRETTFPISKRQGSPVVFLRPFGIEELLIPAHQGPRRDGIAQLLPRRSEFLEDIVTWMLWSRSEVLAIAKPAGKVKRTVGAVHHALSADTHWTAAVAKLMDTASMIVLVPGTTPGVSWEYEKVSGSDRLARKTLLINPEPASTEAEFLAFIGSAQRQVQHPHHRDLQVLAAVLLPSGPKLLCSTLAEDLDYEVAVEWAMRNELQESGRSGRRLSARLAGLIARVTNS